MSESNESGAPTETVSQTPTENGSLRKTPIVSSAHLADGGMPALSEFEFGLILASHAFERWTVRGMLAAGAEDLSATDIQILHSINHRSRAKRIADICLVLNIEDTYTVTYSVKKLEKAGLVDSAKVGKEKSVSTSAKGQELCRRYKQIREMLLVNAVQELGLDEEQLSRLSTLLRSLSGQYDQAARGAVSL